TDHAPHTKSDKAKTFDKAPFGVIGLETAFPLCHERLVLNSKLTLLQLVDLLSTKAYTIMGREGGTIQSGARANLAIIDPQLKWTYDAVNGFSKSQNSPFHGRQLTGKNLCTIYDGKVVYQDNQYTDQRFKQRLTARNK
ncbi:MAG TPA: hypothetical protein V6C72_18680, partial [Chroococcales cyanobacterium]